MLNNIPTYISLAFALTTVVTLLLFVWTIRHSNVESIRKQANWALVVCILWLMIQALLTLKNVYLTDTDSFPPKIVLFGILPALLLIILLFVTPKGRRLLDSLPLRHLTYLHMIRVPVEIVLFWLFLNKVIPELMTFEGRNFDILAGISAPIVANYTFKKSKIGRRGLLLWNIICLGLLLNIVVNALLSTPSPIQKFAFDQPNIAILHFPFSWLPTFIVPIVLLAHLTAIRQLVIKTPSNRL